MNNNGILIECENKNNGWSDDTVKTYINAYKELETLISNNSRDFARIDELISLCKDGQKMGIEELQQRK